MPTATKAQEKEKRAMRKKKNAIAEADAISLLRKVTGLFKRARSGDKEAEKELSIWASYDLRVKKTLHSLIVEVDKKSRPDMPAWPEPRVGGWHPIRKK